MFSNSPKVLPRMADNLIEDSNLKEDTPLIDVNLTDSPAVHKGLRLMTNEYLGSSILVEFNVRITSALFILELVKLVEDIPEWFPEGKDKTINDIAAKVNQALDSEVSK